MKKNFKKIMAVILAAIVVMTTFAACSKNKDEGEGAPADETVNATENSTEPTEEGWSENTTAKKEEENTSAQSSDSTTKKNETTTKASSSNGSQTTTKKPVTTTKKQETTTKKPVTTTKPSKPTTTKPPVTTTKPVSKPLTAAQKQWVIDNYFKQFPKYGAKEGFYVEDIGTDNGLDKLMDGITQDNYKKLLQERKEMGAFEYEAKNTECVLYNWTDVNGESVLRYWTVITNSIY